MEKGVNSGAPPAAAVNGSAHHANGGSDLKPVKQQPVEAGAKGGDGGSVGGGGKGGAPAAPSEGSKSEAPAKPISYLALYKFGDKFDWLLLLLGTAGGITNGAAMPIFAIFFGNLMNSFGQNLDNPDQLQESVNNNVLTFIYIGAGAFLGAYLQMACWTATATRQVNRIRHRYLGAVLRQEIGYFDTTGRSGRLLQGLNEDCITIAQGIGDKVGMTIFNLTMCIAGISIAFVRGWDMTLVMLAVMPLLAAMGFAISVALARYTAISNKAYGDANSIAQQALSNIRTVYSFNAEDRTREAYSASLQEPLRVGISQGFLGGLTMGVTNLVAFCAYALAMWYGGKRVADGAYNGGDVLNVLFAAIIGGFSLGQAAPNLQYFAQAKAAGARVFELMDRQPLIDPDAPGETLKVVNGSLEFRDVTFAYPSRPDVRVFRSFDLEVPAGATVALVGESGSGKSTVVGLIERFYDPQAGQVLLDGVDIRRLQLRFLRSQLGLVSQEPTLFATTIRANIAYGRPGATMEEIVAAAKSANAHDFITRLPKGYDTHVGEKGVQMSGGQKQRIAISRAILKDPKILLLDEATSALDAQSERIVQEALDRLMVGRTTVVVAHRLSTIIHSDIIAVVKKGHIVEQGTHASLMAENGAYATLVALQNAESAVGDDDEEGQEEAAGEAATNSEQADASVHVTERAGSIETSRPSLTGGVVDKALDTVVVVDGVLSSPLSHTAAGKVMSPSLGVPRTVSGWRRFASYRRKPAAERDAPPAAADKGAAKAEAEEPPKKVPFSRMAALNKPELPALFTGLIGSTALGLLMPAFSIAFSSLISTFYNPDIDELKSGVRKWSIVFAAIGFGAFFFSLFQSYSFNYMGQKLALRVRLLLMKALLRQEVGFYDQEKNNSGVLTAKLSADALAVKGQFGDTMGMLTQNAVTLIAGLVIAFINGWKMTLVAVGAMPIIGVSFAIQTKFMLAASTKEDESFAQANQTAAESLSNIRTIAAFGMEDQVFRLYGEKLQKPTQEAETRANSAGLGFGFSQFVLFGVYSLAFWFAGLQVKNGESTFEEVLKVFFAIFLAAMGAAQAQAFFPDVAKGKAAVQHVFSIIDREPAIDASSPDGERPLTVEGSIELKDVTFAYPARPEAVVFRRFCLSVPAGATVALVGESGSGKSTVVGLIERFYDPQAGQVLLDGRDIRTLNLHWLREQVALVSQEPVLFNLTVIENIRFGRPDATLEQVIEAAKAANADTFISALPEGYNTKVGEAGIQLSGGQKQRVAIARALIKNPRILLLDEATSALDAESEHVVQEALDRLMQGRTTVVVAHRLSTIRDADSIAVVSRGRIIEQGNHAELMTHPNGAYARLVKHQLTRGRSAVKMSFAARGSEAVLSGVAEEEEEGAQ